MRRRYRLCHSPSLAFCFLAILIAVAPARASDFGPGFKVRTLAADGGTVSVTVGGRGPPVVVLHGYAQTSPMWKPLAMALAPCFMAAGFAYCASFPKTATDFADLAKVKLAMPVLSIGGEKSWGDAPGAQAGLMASDVAPIVLKDTGHWTMEERPQETIPALVRFL
jgi:pimeloyl-ACP methyl ester carboxylesterase